jgi:anti-sigma regulatory factor (Ser/Thr protein kinase)
VRKEYIKFYADLANIVYVRDFLRNIGEYFNLTGNQIYSLQLAVEESITNIIRHGYTDRSRGKISVEVRIRYFKVTVRIIDRGIPFDPRQVGKPDLQEYVQKSKTGGLGIMMIRNLTDAIDYRITHRGNELFLTKLRKNVAFYSLYIRYRQFIKFCKRFISYHKIGNHI